MHPCPAKEKERQDMFLEIFMHRRENCTYLPMCSLRADKEATCYLTEEYKDGLTIDFGATGDLVGKEWVIAYRASQGAKAKEFIERHNPKVFKFANADRQTVQSDLAMPFSIQDTTGRNADEIYRAHVIPADCPALWSLPSIRGMGGKVDTDRDEISFASRPGKPVYKLRYTSRGHYVLPFAEIQKKQVTFAPLVDKPRSALAADPIPVEDVPAPPTPGRPADVRLASMINFGVPITFLPLEIEEYEAKLRATKDGFLRLIAPGKKFDKKIQYDAAKNTPGMILMKAFALDEAYTVVARGMKEVPMKEPGFKDHIGAYVTVWNTDLIGFEAIVMREVRFDTHDDYSLVGAANNTDAMIIIMFAGEQVDAAIKSAEDDQVREGVQPNIRSLKVLREGTPLQQRRELVKLHVRLKHLPANRLVPLLKTAGFNEKILEAAKLVEKWCKGCRDRMGANLEPTVSITLICHFNELVGLDIFFFFDDAYLHGVDVSSRLSSTQYLVDRQPINSLVAFTEAWIKFFGRPLRIKLDRDGSFDNWEWRRWADRNAIILDYVPGQAKSRAGIVERHNKIIEHTAHRLVTDGVRKRMAARLVGDQIVREAQVDEMDEIGRADRVCERDRPRWQTRLGRGRIRKTDPIRKRAVY